MSVIYLAEHVIRAMNAAADEIDAIAVLADKHQELRQFVPRLRLIATNKRARARRAYRIASPGASK